MVVAALLTAVVLYVGRRRGWFSLQTTGELGAGSSESPVDPLPLDRAAWLLGLFLLQILAPLIPLMALRDAIDLESMGGRALIQWLAYAAQLPFAIAIVARSARAQGTMKRSWLAGALGLVCVAPVIVLGSQIASLLQQAIGGETPPQLAHESLRAIIEQNGSPWAWAVIAAVVIGAPIFEEIAYRGALHGAMRSLDIRPWPTIVLTSVFFAIMHLGAIPTEGLAAAMTGLVLLSISLGLLRERTGGLIAPILCHSLFNVANIAMAALATAEG
jgi:membrane protease YdiL (CAAX protease family)